MWNQAKTVVLLGALTAVVVGLLAAVAPGSWLAFGLVAVGMNLLMYFYSDRLVLRIQGAIPLAPESAPVLHRMNAELAAAAGVPAPRLYLVDAPYANAFATGRNPSHAAIAVTRGLLDTLTFRELRGVMAHEMAHIRNRDVLIATIAALLAAIVGAVANALQFTWLFGGSSDEEDGSSAGNLAIALLAPVGATLLQLAISRSREYVADDTAARLTRDPGGLASALERLAASAEVTAAVPAPATASLFIVNPLAGAGSWMSWFSTHPPIRERIARLKAWRPHLQTAA